VLKKICRKKCIARWPYRLIRKIDKGVVELEQTLPTGTDLDVKTATLKRLRSQIIQSPEVDHLDELSTALSTCLGLKVLVSLTKRTRDTDSAGASGGGGVDTKCLVSDEDDDDDDDDNAGSCEASKQGVSKKRRSVAASPPTASNRRTHGTASTALASSKMHVTTSEIVAKSGGSYGRHCSEAAATPTTMAAAAAAAGGASTNVGCGGGAGVGSKKETTILPLASSSSSSLKFLLPMKQQNPSSCSSANNSKLSSSSSVHSRSRLPLALKSTASPLLGQQQQQQQQLLQQQQKQKQQQNGDGCYPKHNHRRRSDDGRTRKLKPTEPVLQGNDRGVGFRAATWSSSLGAYDDGSGGVGATEVVNPAAAAASSSSMDFASFLRDGVAAADSDADHSNPPGACGVASLRGEAHEWLMDLDPSSSSFSSSSFPSFTFAPSPSAALPSASSFSASSTASSSSTEGSGSDLGVGLDGGDHENIGDDDDGDDDDSGCDSSPSSDGVHLFEDGPLSMSLLDRTGYGGGQDTRNESAGKEGSFDCLGTLLSLGAFPDADSGAPGLSRLLPAVDVSYFTAAVAATAGEEGGSALALFDDVFLPIEGLGPFDAVDACGSGVTIW